MQQDEFEEELQAAVLPLVNDLIKANFASPPPHLLIPEKVWRENIRKELIDVCTGKQIRNRLFAAQNVILEDLKSQASLAEFERFQTDWKQGMEKMTQNNMAIPEAGSLPPTLQSLMGLTEETLSKMYEIGIRRYKAKDFIQSADVFFFMTLIDYLRHNIWISLGLSEQQNGHFELALAAYSMAVMTKSDNPVAYLQSAECSLSLLNAIEASQYLELAKEVIEKVQEKARQRFLDQLHLLEQRCKLL